ncbi:hypothetical protein S7711_06907 [Stachybotrys chartarum IBT 7711]|uniref:Cation-transporting P-type ATPase N-terminal domain-containing protein n=1 Tax=Stachybotrys chartarum (strain CBS 109288 / IBT 7711) TaxID=1280523 RepID=A0A084AL20_STACB|nr:hypothetical protein S7711_06907 [Stachybotrys chartarum IBT 7711]
MDGKMTEHIRWDEEQGSHPLRHRRYSSDSMAIRRNSRTAVDPAAALPVQYRTVSFQIEETKGKAKEIAKRNNTAARDLNDLVWHTISPLDLLQRLSSSPTTGLSSDQAKRRLQQYGRNAPSPPKSNRSLQIFGYFFKGFGSILLVASALVFIAWRPLGEPAPALANLALAIVLFAVFLINAGFNMFQDWSTSRVMASIKDMLPEQCQVTRDEQLVHVPAENIVPGDLVTIKAGNKLPADLRFVQVSSDAKFDRSVLTGESKPVAATVDHTDANYLETRNIGLQGTHCIMGNCVGVVVATGDKTVFGRIARLTQEPTAKMTPLEREILYFVVVICIVMVTMILVVIIAWATWLRHDHPDWMTPSILIVNCVSVAVAFMPEGLPIAITSGLTITANLMKKNAILCKSLKTVETLGSVSIICSDKTGTLTEGKMTLTDISIGNQNYTAEEACNVKTSTIVQLGALAALCNGAELDAESDVPIAQRKVFGDATDSAILRFSESLDKGNVAYFRACWRRVYELAFNSKNKFMIRCFANSRPESLSKTLTDDEARRFHERDQLLTIKGAPDVLVDRCSHYLTASGIAPIDAHVKDAIEHTKNMYSSQGKRCLLLASRILPVGSFPPETTSTQYEEAILSMAKSGLNLVGLVAIVDPLRPEIPEVVETLRKAGIRIAMVTGDFALTALAISREAGIVRHTAVDTVAHLEHTEIPDNLKTQSNRAAIVVSGPELLSLNEHQWKTLTQYEEVVFARTTPEQKLRIVREFQRENVVAMTGDGVNDAPSLKAADVGISLSGGSDIAMEAADMVLLDKFSSVVVAVQYGRVVFDNLKKVIAYLLPAGSFAEFWPVMTFTLFGLPQILSSFLMIIICCFTDCAAATMLAFEKPEADVLLRPPRNVKKDHLVSWQLILHAYGVVGVMQTLASYAMSFWYLQRRGIPFGTLWFSFGNIPDSIDPDYYNSQLAIASSIYFVNLVVMQWFNLMATRTRRLSMFQHPPAFNRETQNLYLFPAIGFSLLMAIFWLYPPAIAEVIGTSPVPAEYWFFPFAFGIYIILLDEARRCAVRRWPGSWIGRAAW